MSNIVKTIKNKAILIRLLPLFSFIISYLVLYSVHPESFEMTWKGRTYHLFFIWLFSLETILNWDVLQTSTSKLKLLRTVTFIVTLMLPTIYVVASNYFGLNSIIVDLARQHNVPLAEWMPLSIEYLVFAVLFTSMILLAHGINGLMYFAVSVIFLGIVGAIYTVDNLYPYGRFTPFQILVPTTATLAANVLNLMGYSTSISEIRNPYHGRLSSVKAFDPKDPSISTKFEIAWPCAGVESLLIYTFTILLFLKKSVIPWKQRIIYFVVGAIITYFINILRIATIFVISLNTGGGYTPQAQRFHNYYGQLYSITWIIAYPLIIIGSRALWGKIRNRKASTKDVSESPKTFKIERYNG